MNKISCLSVLLFLLSIGANGQNSTDTMNVVMENDKVRVTEYVSSPKKDICGPGLHSHPAHLTILLTGAKVKVTSAGGKTQDLDLKAGTTFWSEAETHRAINIGKNITRVYLIQLK